MSVPTATFEQPPLFETAVSVQFAQLPRLRNAHLGIFWAQELAERFPLLEDDAPLIDPQFELFGEDRRLRPRLPRLRIAADASSRLRAKSDDLSRMVQIQNGRLVVNWLRVPHAEYPRYSRTSQDFDLALTAWHRFVAGNNLGALELNQWEVTYVNQILQGDLWRDARDMSSLLPGLFGPAEQNGPGPLETAQGSWMYELPKQIGRLHVDVTQGWNPGASLSDPQILVLQLTARGPVDVGSAEDLAALMNTGHEAIVDTFVRVTSKAAHSVWRRVK